MLFVSQRQTRHMQPLEAPLWRDGVVVDTTFRAEVYVCYKWQAGATELRLECCVQQRQEPRCTSGFMVGDSGHA